MSAPETNVEKQQARHKPALSGMTLAVVVAAVLAVGFALYSVVSTDEAVNEGVVTTEEVVAPAVDAESSSVTVTTD